MQCEEYIVEWKENQPQNELDAGAVHVHFKACSGDVRVYVCVFVLMTNLEY